MKSYTGGVRHDYRDFSQQVRPLRWRQWSLFLLGIALPVVGVSVLLVGEDSKSNVPSPQSAEPSSLVPAEQTALLAPIGPAKPEEPAPAAIIGDSLAAEVSEEILDLIVASGDSMDSLFRRNDLRVSDLAAMLELPDAAQHLRLLKPGDTLRISHRDGEILTLDREIDAIDLLSIERTDAGFSATVIERPIERRVVGAQGTIRSSLFEAGMAAGVSDGIIMDMAGIFQWDIDFIQDVRTGDRFTVLFEELWRDDEKLGSGSIVAAEFVNRGKPFRAARYTDASGRSDYYTPDGRSVRKAFIRAPVEFTRISGNFDPNRKHPILNTIRAHRGVDYAAPSGTPVLAAGDGKIVLRGKNGGFGNAVVIEHGGNISTLYAHLSRFAAPRVGSRVRQGETIGYVGMSGLATGPHLHYEYRINGVHRNPRTVSLPPADPVPAEYSADFERASSALWSQLDVYQQAWLASAE